VDQTGLDLGRRDPIWAALPTQIVAVTKTVPMPDRAHGIAVLADPIWPAPTVHPAEIAAAGLAVRNRPQAAVALKWLARIGLPRPVVAAVHLWPGAGALTPDRSGVDGSGI
jgi:hypothetical protein